MKIAVFYFSGTGSTWWAINQFKIIAETRNHTVELYSIEKSEEFNLRDIFSRVDIGGFAYPIYGSDLPQIMKTFLTTHIKNLESDRKIPVLVINTMLLFSGDGALIIRRFFKKSNLELKWTLNIPLSSNISIPGFRANPVSQEKLDKRMNKAENALENFILDIEAGKKSTKAQWGILGRFLGMFQRVFEKSVGWLMKYSSDPERCIKCMKCVKECPVENIVYDEIEEKIKFGNNCTWCMRCYTRCPTQAVLVRGRYCDPEKFKRLKPISKDFKIE
ncbi:MAG: EFR1 family ferrodoxin [Promethearchaeota archaeon]